ncbi:MAG: helix-turn-helix transcriptional regulator [Rhodospirillales bacterium]|nr:helix-turn-helix transcriptional regulator [Rhodospirillales bacterium]
MPGRVQDTPPNVGEFVRKLRRSRGLTLEDLAEGSGVSKSMLSQIERNKTNPTLATVWRLCECLGVSVDAMFEREDKPPVLDVLPGHATPSIRSADGKFGLRILGPLDLGGLVEWYEVRAEPGALLTSEAHDPGTTEHLTVLGGVLTIEVGGEQREVATDETVRYRADQAHAIRNKSDKPARALLVVMLSRP